jgi:hypothetical protein
MVEGSSVSFSTLPDGKTFSGNAFPLLVKPSDNNEVSDLKTLTDWIAGNTTKLDELLLQHGAVLFRKFPVESALDFDAVIQSTKLKGMKYIGRQNNKK